MDQRSRLIFALGLALSCYGCTPPFSPGEFTKLSNARAQWAARPFADYVFETRHDCFFCLPEEAGPVRITVRQGVMTDVTLIETGQPVSPDRWYTIDQFFELIPGFASDDGVDDVSVRYDSALGYPATVSVRFDEGILDAGSLFTITAVGPAP